ncbi:MAG: hypothetical protein AB7O43_18995, partial [Hyphomicrobiaceae bacterium]
VEVAAANVRLAASVLGVRATIETRIGDSFVNWRDLPSSDIVVTNPPWEHIKPVSRELAQMGQSEQAEYRRLLRVRSDLLNGMFPNARAERQWAGWGTNLARCGWELALRVCAPNGTLGIVLPATLFADQASVRMRGYAFSNSQLQTLATYPAEARLFDKVDQSVVTAVFRNAAPTADIQAFPLTVYDAHCRLKAAVTITRESRELGDHGYALPVGFGAAADHVMRNFSHLERLGQLESDHPHGLWAGREVDETRMSEKVTSGERHPFIKGKMIERHRVRVQPSVSVRPEYVSSPSVRHERIVWRDVSRASQARRMISAIIPERWVAGNSLHVAYFNNGDRKRLRALYALISSYVVEFQVRTRLATGHVSLGAVRSARIPALSSDMEDRLARASDAVLKGGRNELLEVAVAQAFQLKRDEYAALLDCFPKLGANERDTLLDQDTWAAAAE